MNEASRIVHYFPYLCARMRRILFLSLLSLQMLCALALGAERDIRVSLLTCSPGSEVYELYGHTALRVQDMDSGQDMVYNYGVFDFNTPAFAWHFVLGECDYMVMPIGYSFFRDEYVQRGSQIVSQSLNLTPKEAERLLALLQDNCLPQNMVYRYDFLRNNCTTKVRDIVEQAVEGEIVYPTPQERETYRGMIHHYTASSPWCEAGQDLLLGCNSDTILSGRAMLFLPEYLFRAYAGAEIRSEQRDTRPLVSAQQTLLEKGVHIEPEGFIFTPLQCAVILFAVMLLIMAVESFFACQLWLLDALLMTVQGLVGVLLCFLFLFSKHPTLDSNFLLWLFNPLPLMGLYYVVRAARRKRRTLWHGFNFAWLFFFIVFIPWVPQYYASGIFPLALTLMTRPVSYFLAYRRDD